MDFIASRRPGPARLLILLVSGAVAASALSGCGGDGETQTGSPSASTSESSTGGAGGAGGAGGSGGKGGAVPDPYVEAVKAASWAALAAAPKVTGGAKQDDLFFLDASNGFAASGPNEAIYATTDGGATWNRIFQHAGTYFRSLLFLDPMHGFAGNIGAGLSAQISDATLMYETKDGGATWDPVTNITGAAAKGLCNFTAADETHLFGIGRANGPAHLLRSHDAGANWEAVDLGSHLSMAIDAHFVSPTEGVVAGMNPGFQHCSIVRTTDGGDTFKEVFASKTASSLCWKFHFPSPHVGYATVQDTAGGPGTFAKTTDGGATWKELPLPTSAGYGGIGVGFITDDIGWIAAEDPSLPVYRTLDGGATWEVDPNLEAPINRFRFIDEYTAYAIGGSVWKLEISKPGK